MTNEAATSPVMLPVEVPANEAASWLRSLGTVLGAELSLAPPSAEGPKIEANGEVLATLVSAPRVANERLTETAGLVSRLVEDRVVRRDLVAQMARLWKEQNFLTTVATALTAQSTPEETAQRLLPRVTKLLAVQRASIVLARADRRLVVAAANGGTSQPGMVLPEGGIAEQVFQTGEAILVENTTRLGEDSSVFKSLHRDARTNSFLSVPIVSNGTCVGVINVTDRAAGKSFSAEDQKLVTAIAAQLGIALANVHLLEEARRSEALKRELDLASKIQRSLLPKGPFRVTGFDVFGRCEAATYVGGDSFEIAARPGGGLWAAVFDVSGHGVSAALLMASARMSLRGILSADESPAEAARALNEQVVRDAGDTGLFLTAVLARIEPSGHVRLTSLGHPPVFVVRTDGRVESFEKGGAPAGIVDDEVYEEEELDLGPGDLLVQYSDGASEASDGASMFGEDGVVAAATRIASRSAEEAANGLFEAVYDHLKGRPVNDDITVLCLKPDATRVSEGRLGVVPRG
ncbi:MAG: SpoIIE family protein phosphatase [Acidobacteria bacterium]|nr:SpoIIE family protein phosphatase [Acidobacteriota bacterium]